MKTSASLLHCAQKHMKTNKQTKTAYFRKPKYLSIKQIVYPPKLWRAYISYLQS